MTPAQLRLWNRLQRQAASMRPDLARAMMQAFDAVRDMLPEAELAQLIESGAWQAMFLPGGQLDEAALDRAFSTLRSTFHQSIADSMAYFDKDIGGGIAFNVLNPRILDALRTAEGKVMDTLKADVRELVRSQVQAGIEAGVNPRTTARVVRQTLGLAPNQAQYVTNFRAELEAGSRKALSRMLGKGVIRGQDGKIYENVRHVNGAGLTKRDMATLKAKLGKEPLTKEQIDRMVAAYQKRLESWNAESVARTMAHNAQAEGQRLAWQDAIDKGFVDGSVLYERWVTAHDDRVRPEHAAVDGEVIPFGGTWSNGLRPGEDWGCRCVAIQFVSRDRAEAA